MSRYLNRCLNRHRTRNRRPKRNRHPSCRCCYVCPVFLGASRCRCSGRSLNRSRSRLSVPCCPIDRFGQTDRIDHPIALRRLHCLSHPIALHRRRYPSRLIDLRRPHCLSHPIVLHRPRCLTRQHHRIQIA